MYKSIIIFSLFIILNACKQKAVKTDFLASNLDTTIIAADDFFEYANGGWIKNNPIPNEESGWGIGNLVVNENLNRLKEINEKAAAQKNEEGSTQQKIGDFWSTAMDTTAIEKQGLQPLKLYLNQIDIIKDKASLVYTIAALDKIGVSTILDMNIGQDNKNSDAMALKLSQSGLYLPEREYYLKTDNTSINIRNEYLKLIIRFLTMSGINEDTSKLTADHILALETSIAKVHRKLEDLRDPYRNYNKISINDLYKLIPSLQIQQYFTILGVPKLDSVIVRQPEYYTALEKLLQTANINDWKMLLRFRLLSTFSEALPNIYGEQKFKFDQLLSGAKERKPRWKRVLNMEEDMMGELLGQLFVKEYFNEKAKKRYVDLVESIRNAYKERIEKLTWMSDSTKQKALYKLAAIKKKVGYPDKWKDFSALEIKKDNYIDNLIRANQFWLQYYLNKLGKPVNREEWNMSPQTYNAYYNPSNNEIVLPAGIFTVPGYSDEELDDALIYGYAGASTIGHEITHGFDDQGRQYDEKGNLKNWWTKKDEEEFNKRANIMVTQFSNYMVVDTLKINGKNTLGENIADLGGILLGWDAFTKTEQYKKNEKIAGLTPGQRFFLGYALGWLYNERKEALRNLILTDEHSPAKYRVNGPFVDVDVFYTTFNIKPTNKMYVADSLRVRIW